ncbi:MAG: hypothetical protein KDD70_16235 [Bdellovibrionales bacterium]|nr:hypothetical protein [Bdellovibrionales bacterium]
MQGPIPFLSKLYCFFLVIGAVYGLFYISRSTTQQTRLAGADSLREAVSNYDIGAATKSIDLLEGAVRLTDNFDLPPFAPYDSPNWNSVRPKVAALADIAAGEHNSTAIGELSYQTLSAKQRTELQKSLRKLKEGKDEVQRFLVEMKRIENEEDLNWEKIPLLKKDLREMLNLPEIYGDDDDEEVALHTYSDGILAGLPVVDELPEGSVKSAVDLSKELENRNIPLPKLSPEEFGEQLIQLKAAVAKVIEELERLELEYQKAQQGLQEAKDTIKAATEESKSFVAVLLEKNLRQVN